MEGTVHVGVRESDKVLGLTAFNAALGGGIEFKFLTEKIMLREA
jgi:hypothetical protein